MIGKKVRVKQTNYQFGVVDRYVNLISCFKYIPNGNIYLIYSDVDTQYSIIYYGSGHARGNSALCMQVRTSDEVEIIKEYIFKLINKGDMTHYQQVLVNEVETLEVISSYKLELKDEVLDTLIELTIPKEEVLEPVVEKKKSKKKVSKKVLLITLLLFVVASVGMYAYSYFSKLSAKGTTSSIVCKKTYNDKEIKATVEETNRYNFNVNGVLDNINTKMIYKFSEEDYETFILRGLLYKYMPDKEEGKFENDEKNHTFKTESNKKIGIDYSLPTDYEEVLAFYKEDGYDCVEEIVD